jgi:putative ABC transport system permease protein
MLSPTLKLAWKVLLRRKFFTAVSLFGIGFTLLVLTLAAAVLESELAPRAPETRLARTLALHTVELAGGGEPGQPNTASRRYKGNPGYRLLDATVRGVPGVERVSLLAHDRELDSYVDGRRIRSHLKRADGEFWRILDFDFLEGGPYGDADEAAGRRVAVINETTRRRFFDGAPAVGRTLTVDGQTFTVVGVVRDVPMARRVPFAEIWVPIASAKSSQYRHEDVGDFIALLLARDRADIPAIQREVVARLQRFDGFAGTDYDRVIGGGADTRFEALARDAVRSAGFDGAAAAARMRAVLAGLAVLFMLLPAINLTNLNLSRILERSSEIGVRKAFGASASALTAQFLAENVVLTLLGGALGFAGSALLLALVNRSGVLPYAAFAVDVRVFLFGLAAAAFFGVLSGVYPAWRMARMHPVQALRGRS